MLNPPHTVQGPLAVATPVRAAEPSVVTIALASRHCLGPTARSLETTFEEAAAALAVAIFGLTTVPRPTSSRRRSSDGSENNPIPAFSAASSSGSPPRAREGPTPRCRATAQETFVRPAQADMQYASRCAHTTVHRADACDVVTEMMSAEEHARTRQTASPRAVLRRRRCGPPPGNCGGSSVAARMKMRRSTGMPSVLHSNPTDRGNVDMYVIVLPAETDLALTADRKAPSLGLESPNENIRADSRR